MNIYRYIYTYRDLYISYIHIYFGREGERAKHGTVDKRLLSPRCLCLCVDYEGGRRRPLQSLPINGPSSGLHAGGPLIKTGPMA